MAQLPELGKAPKYRGTLHCIATVGREEVWLVAVIDDFFSFFLFFSSPLGGLCHCNFCSFWISSCALYSLGRACVHWCVVVWCGWHVWHRAWASRLCASKEWRISVASMINAEENRGLKRTPHIGGFLWDFRF
jgi:hypothetical protein